MNEQVQLLRARYNENVRATSALCNGDGNGRPDPLFVIGALGPLIAQMDAMLREALELLEKGGPK